MLMVLGKIELNP